MTTEEQTTQHTPGPWVPTSIRALSVARRENALRVCTLNSDEGKIAEDERRANARLIAAAPDLLRAVKFCLKYPDSIKGETGWGKELSELIAKAEGTLYCLAWAVRRPARVLVRL